MMKKTKFHGKQMSDKWIEKNLTEMFDNIELRADILENSYKYLTAVSKNGSKAEIFELSKNATKIKNTKL